MSSVSYESTARYEFFTVCGLSACQRINSILLLYTVIFFSGFFSPYLHISDAKTF